MLKNIMDSFNLLGKLKGTKESTWITQ